MGDKAELVEVPVLGRPIKFKQFNDTQLVLLHRMRQILNGTLAQLPEGDDGSDLTPTERNALDSGMGITSQFLTMLEKMAADPTDQQWLVEQMLGGNLDLGQLTEVVTAMVPQEKKAKAPAKRASRAR
jgi:hypothetical protein